MTTALMPKDQREGDENSPISARSFPKTEKGNTVSSSPGMRRGPSHTRRRGLRAGGFSAAQDCPQGLDGRARVRSSLPGCCQHETRVQWEDSNGPNQPQVSSPPTPALRLGLAGLHRRPPPPPAGLSLGKSKATNVQMRKETGSQVDAASQYPFPDRREASLPARQGPSALRWIQTRAARHHHRSLLLSRGN